MGGWNGLFDRRSWGLLHCLAAYVGRGKIARPNLLEQDSGYFCKQMSKSLYRVSKMARIRASCTCLLPVQLWRPIYMPW